MPLLSNNAVRKLRELRRRLELDTESGPEVDRDITSYDMVVFTTRDEELEEDGTKLSDIRGINADNGDLSLSSYTDAECYAIEVNSIPDEV